MKKQDKIKILKENKLNEWNSVRNKIFDELSQQQSIFCICGKLSTGLHELNCKKFNNLVDSKTLKILIEKYEGKSL